MADRAVLLFAKPARPGVVKTRLVGPGLAAEEAAALQEAFLADLAERLLGAPFDLIPCWALAAGEALPVFPPGGRPQVEGDLGQRLYEGFRTLEHSHRLAAAIGSDHPELPLESVTAAFDALERGADLVLGPAVDGGYYLIALRPAEVSRRLFDGVAWSTPSVLDATRDRARELGLAVHLLPALADVDTPADLAGLAERLEAAPSLCPRTFAELARQGRVGAERSCAS